MLNGVTRILTGNTCVQGRSVKRLHHNPLVLAARFELASLRIESAASFSGNYIFDLTRPRQHFKSRTSDKIDHYFFIVGNWTGCT